MFRLVLKFEGKVIDTRTFEKIPVTIGRREDNDLVVDNLAVSGHHAVFEREGPDFYVLVDLDSLNGTFLNEERISRERVMHGDSIVVGKHTIIFEYLRSEGERRPPGKPGETLETSLRREDSTPVDPDAQVQQTLTAMEETEKEDSGEGLPEKPRRVTLGGSLTIISGGTPEIIDLTKRFTTLGKGKGVDIKCSGMLIGKTAALINKRPNGFFLAYAEGLKKPEVNGEQVLTQVQLRDGDEVVVGSTRMMFNLSQEPM